MILGWFSDVHFMGDGISSPVFWSSLKCGPGKSPWTAWMLFFPSKLGFPSWPWPWFWSRVLLLQTWWNTLLSQEVNVILQRFEIRRWHLAMYSFLHRDCRSTNSFVQFQVPSSGKSSGNSTWPNKLPPVVSDQKILGKPWWLLSMAELTGGSQIIALFRESLPGLGCPPGNLVLAPKITNH